MHLQDFLGDANATLDLAFQSAKLHPKKRPDIDTAMRVVGDTVATQARAKIAKEVLIDLMDQVSLYELANGEYADIPGGDEHSLARDNYESGMDDAVEKALEKYDEHLSADWLGRSTIDTRLWLSNDNDRTLVQALADSAAKEIFKEITHDKTPNQILASAGIVKADVEARLAANTETPEEEQTMGDNNPLSDVIAKVKAHVGDGFDQMAVYENFELIVEDDDVLGPAAAARLGLTHEDVDVLQIAALELEDAASDFVKMVDEHKTPSARQVKREAAAVKAEAKAAAAENAVAPTVLAALKDCGAPDTATAEALGVSRSTYNNYIKGKTPFVPDEAQYDFVRKELVDRANMLLRALGDLDGIPQSEIV